MRGNLLKSKLVFLPSMIAAVLSLTHAAGLSAQESPGQSTTSTTSSTTIATDQSTVPVEVALRNMKDAAHRLRTSVLDVINDVEQRDMVVTGEPMIIQPIAYKDKQPIGWAREMLELGPAMPPRKKWLVMDVNNVGELVQLLQADFDAAAIPDNIQMQAKESWNAMKAILQDVQSHYKTLQELTKGPQFNNIEIGKAALAIYDDMSKLEKPWKAVVHTTRSK